MGRTNAWVFVAAMLLTGLAVQAESPLASRPERMYNVPLISGIEEFVTSQTEREKLAINGFIVTEQQFKQIFSAYIDPPMPQFITTDSVWHTYHVLLEEGVRQLEDIQTRRLARFARRLVEAAGKRGKADLLDYYAAVGLGIQDAAYAKSLPKDSPAATTLGDIARLSDVIHTPIGFPIIGEQFRPKSFYTKTPALRTYFTARQWYSQVLFRLRHKGETQLALELSLLIEADPALRDLYAKLNGVYDSLLARPVDADAGQYLLAVRKVLGKDLTAAAVAKNIDALGGQLAVQLALPQVNDLWLSTEQYQRFPEETRGFRLLPSRELPCAVLFHNTTDPKIRGRSLPTGLDFLAASPELRSPAANRAIEARETPDVARAILSAACPALPDSLYGQAMKAMALLQEPLPPAAPKALRSAAWSDKQLSTQLAAWAEQRHTWALHAKRSERDFGTSEIPPGLVEPYPKFYEAMGNLCRATARALRPSLVEEPLSPEMMARNLLSYASVSQGDASSETQPSTAKDPEKAAHTHVIRQLLSDYATSIGILRIANEHDWMEEALERCLAGTGTEADVADLKGLREFCRPAVVEPLEKLAEVCDQLRDIARKQLAGGALTKEDQNFIRSYGSLLGGLHFYEDNAADNPRDDFPMISPVFGDPAPPGQVLYVGVTRPHALYVLVEVNGVPVLHRGAALSYREVRRPMSEPLDDGGWMQMLAGPKAPPAEGFTGSFQVTPAAGEAGKR